MTQSQPELVKLADLKGPPSPYIHIGPDEPDPEVFTIWIDTSGVEPV